MGGTLVFQIYDTLSREIRPFVPFDGMKVGIYVCGPTVYDYSHVGHARTYLSYDAIVRYLEYKGYKVTYVINITDVNDKIIIRARETGQNPFELAKKFENAFYDDMKALQIRSPDVYSRVTDHIPDIISMIESLIQKGYAYESGGDVYFHVPKIEDFGKLSKQSLDQMMIDASVDLKEKKRSPYDFALWKGVTEKEQSWDSPWGKGRPGWHIECSAMAMKYLGPQVDIHGGGTELVFPHHENEIVQSEATSGKKPFVKYWVHTGILQINNEKMSKSLGNFVTVKDLLKRFRPEAFRLFILSSHYRRPIEFSEEAIEQSDNALKKIYETRDRLRRMAGKKQQSKTDDKELLTGIIAAKRKFTDAMDNDLNTAIALASFHELIRIANRIVESKGSGEIAQVALKTIDELGAVFGLFQSERSARNLSEEAEVLVLEREAARKRKDWSKADQLRVQLKQMGVTLRDTPEGSEWIIDDKPQL